MAKISWARAAEALDNVRPGLSPAARQMLLGQAYAETEFGNELPDGSNSNNWGSVGGVGDLGSYEWPDTIEGKKIIRKIARFSTPEKGAEAFAKVVLERYGAGKAADAGDAWGYARALWRDGPNQPELGAPSKAPAYYTGFPPGTIGFAPAGTKVRSKLDDWYRVTAYARMTKGASERAAKALGEPSAVTVVLPDRPDADSTDPLVATALGVVGDTLGGSGGGKPKADADEKEKAFEALDDDRRAEEERIKAAEAAEAGAEKAEAERVKAEADKQAAAEAADAAARAKASRFKGGAPGAPGVKSDNTTIAIAVLGIGGLAWWLLRK